jgi:hypothetical protein
LIRRTEVPRIGALPDYRIHSADAARRTLPASLNRQRTVTQAQQTPDKS